MLGVGQMLAASILAVLITDEGFAADCRSADEDPFGSSEEVQFVRGCKTEPDVLPPHLVDRKSRQSELFAMREEGREKPQHQTPAPVRLVSTGGAVDTHLRPLHFSRQIQYVSHSFNIDPLLMHAIAHVESRHNPQAVSPDGAIGLMQVMPATARRFGLDNPESQLFDPMENLVVSSRYLRVLYGHFGNDLPLVLAAYNAGENAVIRHGRKVPPYRETREFVRRVMDYYLRLRNS